MKLVSLNTWGGKAYKPLIDFIKQQARDTDIFCFQEVWADAYTKFEGQMAGGKPIKNDEIMTQGVQDISSVLKNHTGYFDKPVYAAILKRFNNNGNQ